MLTLFAVVILLCNLCLHPSVLLSQYKLETFSESRKSAWSFVPYLGECTYSILGLKCDMP